jgi:hypothetical protein
MQLNTLQLNDKSITLEPGLPLLIGTVNGGRSRAPSSKRKPRVRKPGLLIAEPIGTVFQIEFFNRIGRKLAFAAGPDVVA